MKKIVALALTVVMILGLLAGCEKSMDAQTLAKKMDEAIAAQSGICGMMNMELDMSMGVTGVTIDMGITADVEYKGAMDGSKMFMGMDMDMEVMGETQTVEMDMYASVADGKAVSYTYSGLDDTWAKTETEIGNVEELQNSTMKLAELPAESLVLAEEKETVGEQQCYVLTVTTTGEQVMGMLGAAMDTLDEETRTILESIDWSGISGTMVYHVNAETFLPLQMTAEVTGLGEAMNSLLSGVMAEMLGMLGGEDLEIVVEIPTVNVAMTDLIYGDIEIPDVPEEGVEAAARNPLQADGSYMLWMNEDAVRIVLPEGYTSYMAETDMMVAVSDDYLTGITYTLVTDVTAENMAQEVENEAQYAMQEDLYKAHGALEDVNGFTVMYVAYNDETTSSYAWKQMDTALLLVMVETTGEPQGMDAILNGIENYEG